MATRNLAHYIGLATLSLVAVLASIGLGVSLIVLLNTFSRPWLISTLICAVVAAAALVGIRRLHGSPNSNRFMSQATLAAICIGILAVIAVGFVVLFH